VKGDAMRAMALFFFSLLIAVPAPAPQTSAPLAYLGFDRNDYPGDTALPILRKSFSFAGYWLSPFPGGNSNSWSGKRELLRSQGFGFALLFAGPTSGQLRDDPYTLKRVAEDTRTAAAAARREGFPPGSIIFLDVEEGGRLPSTYFTYLRLWASELSRLGFRAGIYCSSIPIDEGEGHMLITSDFIRKQIEPTELVYWVYNDACAPSLGCVVPQNPPPPSRSGVTYARIWQFVRSPRDRQTASHCSGYAKNGHCYAPGDTAHSWFLDINSSSSADPSGANK
jgi:Rv2525c-like, glycoside hydrolase-like domain